LIDIEKEKTYMRHTTIIVLAAVLCLAIIAAGEPRADTSRSTSALGQAVAQLNTITEIADVPMSKRKEILDKTEALVSAAICHREMQARQYAEHAVTVANWLTSVDFGDRPKQDKVSQRVVWQSLQSAELLTEGMEYKLLQQLRPWLDSNGQTVPKAEWPRVREQILEFQLHLLRRITANIDPAWTDSMPDPFDPSPYVSGQTFFEGEPLDNIVDPHQRAEAKKAFEKYKAELRRYNAQLGYRELQERYCVAVKDRIGRLYKRAPVTKDGLERLQAYLRIYVSDKKLRAELFQVAEAAAKKAQDGKPKPNEKQ
jgi:hypothetical protein